MSTIDERIAEMEKTVINIWPDNPEWQRLEHADPKVTRIVIEQLEKSETKLQLPFLPDFHREFVSLKQLHLWNVELTNSSELPKFSSALWELDIQGVPTLESISNLPSDIEVVVIKDCPELNQLPSLADQYPKLRELLIVNSPSVPAEWINRLIERAPNLTRIDLSNCSQIEQITTHLPKNLDRLDLNGCTGLTGIGVLPTSLRRLGLRGAVNLSELPESFENFWRLDYLDLAMTQCLRKIPMLPTSEQDETSEPQQTMRTLFLFGSGIMVPPASEHGASPDANVAKQTLEYFEELDLVGPGEVKRCKLLFLGNGTAGKTFLATRLHSVFQNESFSTSRYAHYRNGSTHGIQFLDCPEFEAKGRYAPKPVHLHLWDFGGQEIYHNTHRIFVSRGSVFVVVWNPEQDGSQPESKDGYQDLWQWPRYWLDYIHAESPYNQPLIAIVCADRGKWRDDASGQEANKALKLQLKQQLFQGIGDEYARWIEQNNAFFVVDSERGVGELEELHTWISAQVAEVVDSQGTTVPLYWQFAQEMIEPWLQEFYRPDRTLTQSSQGGNSRMDFGTFLAKFSQAISEQLATQPPRPDCRKLRKVWNNGDFLHDQREGRTWRIERTLRFLTHSGWLYWSPELADSRIIVDQVWALEWVYSALERRTGRTVYNHLVQQQGRFTFSDLKKWCWNSSQASEIDDSDQRLIMSFMKSVGVCFPISRSWRSQSNDETVYISPHHLPKSDDLCNAFDASNLGQTELVVKSSQLHRGHWFRIMGKLCQEFGEEGTYTRDACLIRGSSRWDNKDSDWSILIRVVLDIDELADSCQLTNVAGGSNSQKTTGNKSVGLGGKISIAGVGNGLGDRLKNVESFVRSFLPGYEGNPSDSINEFVREFCQSRQRMKTVFFSYAWDDPDDPAITQHIEQSVDAIYESLKPFEDAGRVRLLRDKKTMKHGDYITRFIQNAGSEEVDLVLVFSSFKYWRSWFCMAEFDAMIESLSERGKSFQDSVLLIEHPSGRIHSMGDQTPLEEYWKMGLPIEILEGVERPKNFPAAFRLKKLSWTEYRDSFVDLIVRHAPTITSDKIDLRREWRPENSLEVIDWIKQKLGLND